MLFYFVAQYPYACCVQPYATNGQFSNVLSLNISQNLKVEHKLTIVVFIVFAVGHISQLYYVLLCACFFKQCLSQRYNVMNITNPNKTRGDCGCSGRVSRSSSTLSIRSDAQGSQHFSISLISFLHRRIQGALGSRSPFGGNNLIDYIGIPE